MLQPKLTRTDPHIAVPLTSRFFFVVLCGVLAISSLITTSTLAQPYTRRSDTTQIIWQLRQIESFVKRAQPGYSYFEHGWPMVVDGEEMNDSLFMARIRALAVGAAGRTNNYPISPFVPPGYWGPFRDFLILPDMPTIIGDSAILHCQYVLFYGGKEANGVMTFARITDDIWRIATVTGLMPFLQAEVKLVSAGKHSLPDKKKRK